MAIVARLGKATVWRIPMRQPDSGRVKATIGPRGREERGGGEGENEEGKKVREKGDEMERYGA